MKKRLSVLVLCIALLATTLASCNDAHTHTYSDDWTFDANNHWHAATCEHTDEKSYFGAHVDFDKNGACDVCGYDADHTHTFQSGNDWTSDTEKHWHAATCNHNVDAIDVANHVDENNDGVCDVCAYTPNHTHIFSESWFTDAENHWHEALCGHDVISDKAPHKANAAGFCEECGIKMENFTIETVADALKAAKLQEKVVYGGTIRINDYDAVEFQKSDKYLWVNDPIDSIEHMYSLIDENTICALKKEVVDDKITVRRDVTATVEWMDGYAFDGSLFDFAAEAKAYGIVNLIQQLYSLREMGYDNYDYTETINEDGSFTFSFGIVINDYGTYFYAVTVTFALDEETGAMTSATVSRIKYAMDQCDEVELLDENNNPVIIDGEKVTYFKLKENATPYRYSPNYSINAIQKVRPFDAIYLPDKLLVTSFDLYDKDPETNEDAAKLPDTLEVETNVYTDIYFANILPETATLSLNGCLIKVKDSEGKEIETGYGKSINIINSINGGQNKIRINATVGGTYTIELTCGLATKTITLVATQPVPETIAPAIVTGGGYTINEKTEMQIYLGNKIHFIAGVADGCDARYTAAITAGNDNNTAALGEYTYEMWNKTLTVSEFTATAAGTYTVTITSVPVPELTCTLTITVMAPPDLTNKLTGAYTSTFLDTLMYTVVFNTEAKTVTITDNQTKKEAVFNYEYNANLGTLTTTFASGEALDYNAKLGINENYELCIVNDNGSFALVPSAEPGPLPDLSDKLTGTYTSTFSGMLAYTVVFNTEEKTVAIADNLNNKNAVYSYDYNAETGLTTTLVSGEALSGNAHLAFNNDGELCIKNEYTSFVLVPSTTTDPDPVDPSEGYEVVGGATADDANGIDRVGNYTTKVAAGQKAYFVTFGREIYPNDGEYYNLKVTCEGLTVQFEGDYEINSKGEVEMLSEDTVIFYFENTTDSEITIEFTVEMILFSWE